MGADRESLYPAVSVVIAARNEANRIAAVVDTVARQATAGTKVEILVADDGSRDDTATRAKQAGASVIHVSPPGTPGNPARARNIAARKSSGDPIVFLDADCTPEADWLAALLQAHATGATTVGGSLDLPPGLSVIARCDYYCGCYLTHSRQSAGWVPHHPPNNISVRRDAFLGTSGFTERAPLSYTNEERHWQAELSKTGHRIYFEPAARVYHHNRPGLTNFMRRNFRWAYTAVEAKAETQSTRYAWLYRFPLAIIVLSLPYALLQTLYILGSWAKVGRFEPLLLSPLVLVSRVAYAAGLTVGGVEYLLRRGHSDRLSRKRWPEEGPK